MNIIKLVSVRLGYYVAFGLVIMMLPWSQVLHADIYSYVDSNGTRWLTNGSVSGKKNVKLLKRTPKKKKAVSSPVALKGGGGKVTCGGHKRIASRSKLYLKTIRKYARNYGVDEYLVRALIRQESCFNPKARSHAGARGLMQLMPGTAKMMGVKNSMDPKQNIRGGVKYLSRMLRRFGGNRELALAAYNAGPGAVEKYNGIPPYRETRNYVVKVMREYQRLSSGGQSAVYAADSGQAAQDEGYARSGFQRVQFTSYKEGDVTVFQAVGN